MSEARTEEPTAARVRQARAEGDTGASAYASQAVGLVIAIALVPRALAALAEVAEHLLRDGIAQAAKVAPDASLDGGSVTRTIVLLGAPLLACVAAAAAASTLVQAQGLARGARRRGFGLPTWGGGAYVAARTLTAGAVVAWVCARSLRLHAADLAETSGRLTYTGRAAAAIASSVAWQVAIAIAAIAAIDVAASRFAQARRLRMSRAEVRRERKESEGDPIARRSIERARAEAIARGAVTDVSRASLVVADGVETACALRYQAGDVAPVIVATGTGPAARAILARAHQLGVPIRESEAAKALAELNAGELIPEALYDAVALLFRSLH